MREAGLWEAEARELRAQKDVLGFRVEGLGFRVFGFCKKGWVRGVQVMFGWGVVRFFGPLGLGFWGLQSGFGISGLGGRVLGRVGAGGSLEETRGGRAGGSLLSLPSPSPPLQRAPC